MAAFAIGAGSAALIFLLRHLLPSWPGMLTAVVLASLAASLFGLPVETIGSHFGSLPDGLPSPRLPAFSSSLVFEVLPSALSFTLLGAVESLLPPKWPTAAGVSIATIWKSWHKASLTSLPPYSAESA